MAARIESRAVIERPAGEVFAYVLDLERNGTEWAPDLKSVEKTSDGPTGTGTTFRTQQEVMGRRRETSLRFVSVEPDRRIDAEADIGIAAIEASLRFQAQDGATRVVLTADLNPRGIFKLLTPLAERQGQRLWDTRMSTLKSVLERQQPDS